MIVYMILSIRMVASISWIHFYDLFRQMVAIMPWVHVLFDAQSRVIWLGIFIPEILYIVKCLIWRVFRRWSAFFSLVHKAFQPSLHVLPSCFRGHLLHSNFSLCSLLVRDPEVPRDRRVLFRSRPWITYDSNLGCGELLSIHDCIHDPIYTDGCIHVVDPFL